MLSLGNTLGSTGASLSLDARVAVGAGVFAIASADTTTRVAQTPVVTTPDQKLPAYNAYEFSYRSDFGKVILLQQNVETGQEVTQVPTEYHLRQYAATQRAQRLQLQQKLYGGSNAGDTEAQKTTTTVTVAKTSAAPSGSPAPAASQPAAPSVAPSAAAAATVAHVDIKA